MRTHQKMKAALLCLALLVLSTASPAQGPISHFVSVGGPDVEDTAFEGTGPGFDKNYSLVAFQYADGSGSGTLIDRWAGFAGTTMLRANIDCVHVVGNTAWVSGEIVQGIFVAADGTEFDLAGRYVRTAVQDNGPNNDPANPDRIGISTQHRRALGPFDCTLMEDEFFDMPNGQAIVR